MKFKKGIIFCFLIFTFLLFPLFSRATVDESLIRARLLANQAVPAEIIRVGSFPVLVGTIIKVILGMVGVLFVVFMVWAGITWMTAAGDSKKIEKARGIIVAAAIGLVIVMAAYAITLFALQSVGIAGTEDAGSQLDTTGKASENVKDPVQPDNPSD